MNFAPFLRPIGRISACITAAQRRSTGSAVYCLPFPLDMPFSTIKTQHRAKYLFPDACLLPGLKSFVQHTARNTKPGGVDSFPLAACPQDEPQTVLDGSVRFSTSPRAGLTNWFGKVLFRNAPHRTRHFTIVRAFRFCGILFHDVPRLVLVWRNRILSRVRLFVCLFSIFG